VGVEVISHILLTSQSSGSQYIVTIFVTIDAVWISNLIYLNLSTRNYK
jgi:hypothetical protein